MSEGAQRAKAGGVCAGECPGGPENLLVLQDDIQAVIGLVQVNGALVGLPASLAKSTALSTAAGSTDVPSLNVTTATIVLHDNAWPALNAAESAARADA